MPPIGVDPYASRMVIDWAETQRMRTGELWKSLREKLRGPDRRTCIVLQHLGLPASDTRALQEILFDVGRQLAVTLELHSHEGEIVLLEAPFAAGMSPQLVESFAEGRPVIRIDDCSRPTPAIYRPSSSPIAADGPCCSSSRGLRLCAVDQLTGAAPDGFPSTCV